MAIDRNSYTSLVESVQEAVATPSMANKPATMASKNTGKKTQASGSSAATSSATNSGISAGRTRKTAPTASKTKMTATNAGSGKVSSTAASSTGVSSGKTNTSSGWGGSNVGGANDAYELASRLNDQQNQGQGGKPGMSRASTPKMKGKAGRGGALSTSAGKSVGTAGSSVGSVADSYEWTAEDIEELLAEGYSVEDILAAVEILSEEEDFDVIDEIIAEGIELYGEEDFIAILEHFNETGEIPEELVDLLD